MVPGRLAARAHFRAPLGAGALTQPKRGGHDLTGALIRPVVDLPQGPGDHPLGDVTHGDGHAGQLRMHQARRYAPVETGDSEILADPQPQFRGYPVNDRGEAVATGHDRVRAGSGTGGSEQRPDLPAGACVVHEQHVRLLGGNPGPGQPGLEASDTLGVPVIPRPVTQERDPVKAPAQDVLDRRRRRLAVVDVDPLLRQ